MQENCEMLDKCGFFTEFKGNSDRVKQGWIRKFCENKIKSELCERKKFRNKTGTPPPARLAPTGKLL